MASAVGPTLKPTLSSTTQEPIHVTRMNNQFTPDESDISCLPQINERELRILWHVDWWDGALTGLLEYRGQKCWFHFHHEDETRCEQGGTSHYHYVLYALTPQQITDAETWYRSRGHWDPKTQAWVGRDQSLHNESWNCPDLSLSMRIGWFKDGRNPEFYGIRVNKDEYGHPPSAT